MMATLWVALDVPGPAEAENWMQRLPNHTTFKIGMELYHRVGPEGILRWTRQGLRVFLDLKLVDIPHTVTGAVANLSHLGIELLTLYIAGGSAMLAAAQQAAPQLALVGVTVLTSLDSEDLQQLGYRWGSRHLVDQYVAVAQQAGLAGVVASVADVARIHRQWPQGRIVVPGLRWATDAEHDQKRVGDPLQALRQGATDLVLGRIVTQADDPRAALKRIRQMVSDIESVS